MEKVAARVVRILSNNDEASPVPYYIAALAILQKAHVYRYLRRAFLPAGLAAVLYRVYTKQETNLLQMVVKWLSSLNGSYKLITGDVCGAIVLAGLVLLSEESISSAISFLRSNISKSITNAVFETFKFLPFVQKMVNDEKDSKAKDLEVDLKKKTKEYALVYGSPNTSLPAKGKDHSDIISMMTALSEKENVKWQTGKVTGSVYHGSPTHQAMLNQAFGIYSLANPLHPDVWPSGMKFESEIVAMTASLVNGGNKAVVGCTTSGGTESIILGIKAHRDYYRQEYGITHPEMVACISAHAAVNKACDMLGIKLVHVPMDPVTFKMDVSAARSAIGPNTIMMYASAPNYAQGVIDDITALGALAVQFNIGLHVDCCLGGFFLPFAKKLGYKIPDFDFGVAGVSSMSLDMHKYGYALKGISVLLYKHTALRQAGYFCYSDWAGGMYTTPTIAGSRSTGMIAQCWASMMALGEEGYLKHVKDIVETTKKLAAGISRIEGLEVIGQTEAMIVCFRGVKGINVYAVVDEMTKRGGWSLGSHQHPACAHLCVTVPHVGFEDAMLSDLRDSVEAVRRNPEAGKHGSASIYGTSAAMPTGPVNEILKVYNDIVLSV